MFFVQPGYIPIVAASIGENPEVRMFSDATNIDVSVNSN